ncbi:glycosyltransferase [bacterium]|nr:glycosyltransferase [bacterium]
MKVLMVSNIYPTDQYPARGSFVKSQVESIRREGIEVEVEYVNAIDHRSAFLRSAFRIFRRSFTDDFDLIHAHFGTTGIISRLQWRKPVVVSYLGSDILGNPRDSGNGKTPSSQVVALLGRAFSLGMNAVIVKSREMRRIIPKRHNVFVVPNGVDFQTFYPSDRKAARKKLGLKSGKAYVLFPSNATWPRKQFALADRAVKIMQEQGIPVELITLYGKEQALVPLYMNACDAMVLTSLWEGSPNVVKEAMACNLPVVSVDVGDVAEVIGGCDGCVLVPRKAADIARVLTELVSSGARTDGRSRIRHLEIRVVARHIIRIYRSVLRVPADRI